MIKYNPYVYVMAAGEDRQVHYFVDVHAETVIISGSLVIGTA